MRLIEAEHDLDYYPRNQPRNIAQTEFKMGLSLGSKSVRLKIVGERFLDLSSPKESSEQFSTNVISDWFCLWRVEEHGSLIEGERDLCYYLRNQPRNIAQTVCLWGVEDHVRSIEGECDLDYNTRNQPRNIAQHT